VTPGHYRYLRASDGRRKLVMRSGPAILSTDQNEHRTAQISEFLNI
jgi:hypothetical protein